MYIVIPMCGKPPLKTSIAFQQIFLLTIVVKCFLRILRTSKIVRISAIFASWIMETNIYRLPTKLLAGNVFSCACLSFCSRGWGRIVPCDYCRPVQTCSLGDTTGPGPAPNLHGYFLSIALSEFDQTCLLLISWSSRPVQTYSLGKAGGSSSSC